MAINPNTNATMAGRVTTPDADYPYGSSKDETAPGAGDGSPYFKGRADDIFGFQQWLLSQAGIVPSGNADTVLASQYGQALVNLINRADRKQWPTISNDVDVDHDILFSAGTIPDSAGVTTLALAASLTKQIDAPWVAGDAAGGLFTGAVAADTTYHCFVIVKDSDGSVDAGFDTDPDAANIPAGYTAYRRVGSVVTDGSANILGFFQSGDFFYFDAQQQDLVTTTPATTEAVVQVSPPALGLANMRGIFNVSLSDSGSVSVLVGETRQSTFAVPTTILDTLNTLAGSQRAQVEMQLRIDPLGRIKYISSVGVVGYFRIRSVGWIDDRS